MSEVLEDNPLFSIDPLVEGRKDLDPLAYSYKLTAPGNYGLDVVLGDDLQINESEMSCWVNFADGNSRDGVGDVTEVAGINCERHRKNPIVLFDHGKHCQLPIALAEDPNTKQYTVEIRPDTRTAKAKCFFYQGKGDGLEKNHSQFCYDIFDMLAKKFIRGGSFAYQIIRAERLQPDYTQGTPPGLHLLATRLLELGPTVIPAHQDTVMKMLDMPGRSDIFYKSLQAYVLPRPEMVVSGFHTGPGDVISPIHIREKAYNAADESHRKKGKPIRGISTPRGRRSRSIDPKHEYASKMGESKPGEKRKIIIRKIPQQHDPSDTPFEHVSRDEYKHESPETQRYFKKREYLRRRGVTPRDVVKRGERRKQTHQRLDKFVQHYRESHKDLPEEVTDIKALRAKYSKRFSDGEKGRVTYSESGWEGPPPEHRPQPTQTTQSSVGRGLASRPKNRIPDPPRPKAARPQGRAGIATSVKNPKGKVIVTGFLRDYKKDPPPAGRKGIKPLHSEEDDYQSLEQGDAPNSSLGQFPAEIDRGQKSQPSDKIDSDKACQIKRDGTANGQKLTKKQEGMFGAACGKGEKAYKQGQPRKLSRNLQAAHMNRNIQAEISEEYPRYRKEERRREMGTPTTAMLQRQANKIAGSGQDMNRGHGHGSKYGNVHGKAMENKGLEDGEKANASVAKQVEQTRFRNRALAKLNSMSKEEIAKAPRVVGTGRGMANKDPISRALISLAKKGKKNMETKGLEDATTNPETKERHELLQEGDAVGMEMVTPTIKDIRAKYQKKKGMARCLKKSVPGSFMVHVESKYLEAVKSAAGKAGIKCECGEAQEGTHKVRLTGLDDAVHKLAGKYGKPGTIGKKGVEVAAEGEKAGYPYDKVSEMGEVGSPYRNRREESIARTERRLGDVVANDRHAMAQIRKPSTETERRLYNVVTQDRAVMQQERRNRKKGIEIESDGQKASHYAHGKRESRRTPGHSYYDIRNEKTGEKEAGMMHSDDKTRIKKDYGTFTKTESYKHPPKKGIEIESDEKAINPPKLGDQRLQQYTSHDAGERAVTENRNAQRRIYGKYPKTTAERRLQKYASADTEHNAKRKLDSAYGRKGLEFNIKIQCPNPEYVIQKAQLFGIGAWEEDGGCVLSGIDEVEIGRFLRQFKILDDAQVDNLFGGRLAGHKSLTPQEARLKQTVGNDQRLRAEESYQTRGRNSVKQGKQELRLGAAVDNDEYLRNKGKKAMEIHVKDSSDNEELRKKEPQEQPLAQDETPADQAEYTETPGEEYPEDSYTDEYGDEEGYEEGDEGGFEDEGPQEKLGAQVLRELHGEMEEFLMKYDEILPLVEHEGVTARLQGKLESVAAELEEIESEFEANYPEYGGLGNKEMEGGMAPENEEEGASSEGLPEPDPDEVVEGMSHHPDDEENEEEPRRGEKALYNREKHGKEAEKFNEQARRQNKNERRLDHFVHADKMNKHRETVAKNNAKGFSLLDYELKSVYDASSFLKNLGQTTTLNEDLKFDSYYHGKSLLAIQTRIDDFAVKGSLLPKAHGDATEGEDDEVNVNHPSGPSHYSPGKEPMQQHGKGSILDHYQDTGDAGDALGEDKDTDSHINDPDGPNSVAQPGKDSDHMSYGHDGEWPHKGSLLPAPSGDATEGEDDEVNVNHPSSNPQAKPGADKDHQWFGKPAEWPHKELAPQGQYYKAIAEAGQYLKTLSQCKAYGEALKEQAKSLAKALDPVAAQIEAVGVSKSSGWDPKLGDEPAQPFGKPAEWPHKSLNNYFDGINRTQAKLDALVKLVKTR